MKGCTITKWEDFLEKIKEGIGEEVIERIREKVKEGLEVTDEELYLVKCK